MTDVDTLADWLKQAKKLLHVLELTKKKDLKESSNAIAKLLKEFKSKYGNEIKEFEKRFEELATETFNALKSKKSEFSVQVLNEKLAKLQLEIELKIGESNPVATPEIRKQVLESARYKPVYLDKRTRIEEAIAELERLPGTSVAVGKLRDLIAAAKLLEPDYKAAESALRGLSGTLEEGRKAAEDFAHDVGGKEFEVALNNARTALNNFEKSCGLGQPEKVVATRSFIDRLLFEIAQLKGQQRKTAVESAKNDLISLAKDISEAIEAETTRTGIIRKRLDSISYNLNRLKEFAPVDVFSPHLSTYRTANTLLGQGRLDEATQEADKIKATIKDTADNYEGFHKEWVKVESVMTPLDQAVEQAFATCDKVHLAHCQKLRQLWRQILATEVQSRRYENALKSVKELNIEADMKAALAPSKMLVVALEHVSETFETRLEPYRKQMKLLAALGGDPKKYEDIEHQRLTAFNELKDRLLKGKPEELESSLKALEAEVDEAINALTVDLPLEESDKKRLELAKSTELEVKKLASDVRAELKDLGGYCLNVNDAPLSDDPSLEGMQKLFATLSERATNGENVVDELTKLLEQAKNKKSTIEGNLKTKRDEALLKAEKITESVAKLRENQDKRYASFFDALQLEVDEARLMSQGMIIPLIDKGAQELERLESDLKTHTSEFSKVDGVNFGRVDLECKKILKEIDTEDSKTYQPTLRKVLIAELESALKPKLSNMSPAEALKALQEFRTDRLQVLIRGMSSTKEKAGQISKRIDSARVDLKKLKGLTPKPEALIASLEQRLDAAAKRPKSDAVGAWLELDSIQGLINLAAQSKERAADLDQRVMKLEFDAEREKLDYEAARDVFERNVLRRVEALRKDVGKDESNEDLYDQIDVALKASNKQANKGDIGLAREQLRLAEAAAKSYLEHPYGAAGVGRRELAGAEKKWSAVAAEFARQADALIAQVRAQKSDTDFDAADGPKTLTALEPLRTLFNPQAFFDYVKPLSEAPPTEGPKLGVHRNRKEQAILHVRRYQTLLAGHVLIPVARDNPFGVVFPSQQQMVAALRALEGALVAC